MRIIAKRALRDFWIIHSIAQEPLKNWFRKVSKANWENVSDLKSSFPDASILGSGRFLFNVKGNHYRIVVKINFHYHLVWIRFVGTHADYDKINAKAI